MNLAEFNALKIGDKVENAMTNGEGIVSAVHEARGRIVAGTVTVKWGPNGGVIEFSYTAHSTAWFHWNKVEPIPDHGNEITA